MTGASRDARPEHLRVHKMKQFPYTVTDFGGVVVVWVCRRCGIVGMLCLGERGDY